MHIAVQVMDVIRGISAHTGRKVSTERGLVYDMNTNEHIPGFVLKVGNSEIAVSDYQAEMLVDYIRAEFMRDEFEQDLANAMKRHPSYRGALNADD